MAEWKFRLAGPEDAEAFVRWSTSNPQVDPKDIVSATKAKNPTVLVFAVEKDGVVQAFAPLHVQMSLDYLGFNPDADGKDKLRAMNMLNDGVAAFAVQYGIREITVVSKTEYPVAQWAMKHDFELEPRQLFKRDLNKIMELAEVV